MPPKPPQHIKPKPAAHAHARAGVRPDATRGAQAHSRPPHSPARSPHAGSTPARPAAPPVYRPQPTPLVLQRKEAVTRPRANVPPPPQARRQTPQAPPAYRPQPTPAVLQRKAAPGAQRPAPAETPHTRSTPKAPPVYRPQPAPRVLQTKQNAAQSGSNTSQLKPNAAQLKPGALQLKSNAAQSNARVLQPKPGVLQAKPLVSQPDPRVLQLKAGAPAPSPFRGVIQRMQAFYVRELDGNIVVKSSVPDNYVWVGKHMGHDLYEPPGIINPFTKTPWYKQNVDDLIPDDEEDMDFEDTKTFFQNEINNTLDTGKKDFTDEESSDSDDAVEDDDKGEEEKRRLVQRFYKAGQLTAIVKSFFELSPEEEQFRQALKALRKRDNKARPGKKQMYAKDTREGYARIGLLFKQTSFLHNPYLRRGFRTAVTKAKIKSGGSSSYEATQGKIRKEVIAYINEDDKKMKWARSDFENKTIWKAFKFLKNNFSNDSKKPSYSLKYISGEDTTDSTPRVGFHHVAWKETGGKVYEGQALNPMNLTALNDKRQILNKKKLKALEKKGEKPPVPGSHEVFGHELTGYMQSDQKEFKRAKKGGHFKDFDTEGGYYQIRVLGKKRKRKREIYDPSVIDSLRNQTTTPSTGFVFQPPPNLNITTTTTTTPVIQPPPIFTPPPQVQNVVTPNPTPPVNPNKKRKVTNKSPRQQPQSPPPKTTNTNLRRTTRTPKPVRRFNQEYDMFGLPKKKNK